MTRIIDVDMTIRNVKKVSTALNRFFKKYPNLEYWREQLEYMADNNLDKTDDTLLDNGAFNEYWCWALHLDICDDWVYIAVIERE